MTSALLMAYYLGVGFVGLPVGAFTFVVIIVLAVNWITVGNEPFRGDYNLFLRCASDGIADVRDAMEPTPRLSDLELAAFAKFLGARWLAVDYRFQGDTMILKPSGIGGAYNLANNKLWTVIRGSRVTITRYGQCGAFLSDAEQKIIEKSTNAPIDAVVLQDAVSRAMAAALRAFLANDIDRATRILTVQSEEAMFRNRPSTLPKRLMFGAFAAIFLWMLMMPYLSHMH